MIYEPKYELELENRFNNIIKVIGVGGAGCNAMINMYNHGMTDVDFVACNTDVQVLNRFPNDIIKLQIGPKLTKGLGAGTDAKVGREAAIESEEVIKEVLGKPTEMVFVTAGMGGGTGTGAAPEIARVSKELGLLTIGVVTFPFGHEGTIKINQAKEGIEDLKKHCDTVLVIKNDRLNEMYADFPIDEGYQMADEVLASGVRSIAELITRPGVINLDFADVQTVLGNAGHAVMGTAEAAGHERANNAIENALNSPLLENNDIKGAKRILVSMAYSDEKPEYKIKMSDQKQIMNVVETKIKSQAEIFKHGYAIDRSLGDKIRVTIVAAQFDKKSASEPIIIEPVEDTTTVGSGLDKLIPTKRRRGEIATGDPDQMHIFEADNRLDNIYNEFVKGDVDYQILTEIPTYKRMNVKLFSQLEIDQSNPDIVELKDLHATFLAQGLIK